MRYALFSDVHGNLEALEAVLADLAQVSEAGKPVDRLVCLGDLVGYNANPREVVERVRALPALTVIRGNHDHEAAHDGPVHHFNALAKAGVLYSRKALDPAQRAWLGALPLRERVDAFTVVHATLAEPAQWGYAVSPVDAALSFGFQETPLCFFGHTHVPHLFAEEKGKVSEYFYRQVALDPAKRYFVNVGSVGQPRDGDRRAAYALYDSAAASLELRRVPYDIPAAQAKIRAAGLPEALAERLARAR